MGTHEHHIFLFDVDGVIVNPIAYRLGITKTLIELCEKIGLQNSQAILPNEAEISAMEAQGVHDVWDITNIVFCDILTKIAQQRDAVETFSIAPKSDTVESNSVAPINTLTEKLKALRALTPDVARPDYLALAQDMASTDAHSHPPDIALKLLKTDLKMLVRAIPG